MLRHDFLYLSQNDVIKCGALNMKDIISDLEKVFIIHNNKDYVLPTKAVLRWGDAESEEVRGRINAMPGYVGGDINIAGIKWIGSSPQNPKKLGLPRASALIILNDPETYFPLAVMDGTIISAMRTGGVTGVAAKYLARENSEVIGIIGAGVQSRTQIMALKEILPKISEVKVFDISQERSELFANEVATSLNLKVYKVNSPQEALENADIIVSATTANEPVVKKEWIKTGCFYSHVGGYEADYGVVQCAHKIIVDDWHQVKHRGTATPAKMFAEGLIGDDDIYGELGEIVSGKKNGRENEDEFIYFNSVGMALEDLTVAKRIYQNSLKEKVGVRLNLWKTPYWV